MPPKKQLKFLSFQSPSASLVSQLPGYDAPHTLLNVVRSRGPGRVRDAVLYDNLEAKVRRIFKLIYTFSYFLRNVVI